MRLCPLPRPSRRGLLASPEEGSVIPTSKRDCFDLHVSPLREPRTDKTAEEVLVISGTDRPSTVIRQGGDQSETRSA